MHMAVLLTAWRALVYVAVPITFLVCLALYISTRVRHDVTQNHKNKKTRK